ncbi:MAG: EscU/YscU/HrcU family type III secretion system export apparatus switch protein [Chthoniobacterales bacterium]|nr:EscU/YscU/HrcU family type III secretion system export apparatus switch protein [Chthoniobacterales bacterium]
MPEDKDTATEEPTPKRLNEAHSRGQFPQAPEFQIVISLFVAYLVLVSLIQDATKQIIELTKGVLGQIGQFEINFESIVSGIHFGISFLAFLLAPLIVATMVGGVLVGGLQSGFRLTPKVFENGFEKLNPVTGMKRIFSFQSLINMFVDFLKLLAVGIIVYISFREIINDPLFYTPVPPIRLGEFIFQTTILLVFRLFLVMLIIAFIHYFYNRKQTLESLRMTKQEVKDEMKQMEGDPMIKGALRSLARRLVLMQSMKKVNTADVVVTNPTHYAVALKYERGVDIAPVVVSKGKNLIAKKIKNIAVENGVPIVENRVVAQSLYRSCEIGSIIPPELYKAVAEILSFVYKTHKYYFHQLKYRRLQERIGTISK